MKCSLSDVTLTKFCKNEVDIDTATDIELHINYCFDCQLRFIEAWDLIKGEEPYKSQVIKVEMFQRSFNPDLELVRKARDTRAMLQQQKANLHRQRSDLILVRERLLRQTGQIYQSLNLLGKATV